MRDHLIGGLLPSLSTFVAGRREMRIAAVVIGVSSLFFIAVAPFANLPLLKVPAFIPIYISALVICDVITAILVFSQFNYSRSWGLLVLGGGYSFTASMTFLYALMFPDLLSPTEILDARTQSTSAMYIFWHGGFPLMTIGYSLLSRGETDHAIRSDLWLTNARLAILFINVVMIAIVIGFTFLVIAGNEYLQVFLQGDHTTYLGRLLLSSGWILSLLALFVIWRQEPKTMIDLWLIVVMCACFFDIALATAFNSGHYDLGWYAGRVYGMLAASSLLVVMLIENSNHYARLVLVSAKLGAANRSLEQQSLRTADDLHRYRGLLEAAPDAMVVVSQRGEIVLLNLQAEKRFGYRRDELVGQIVKTIIPVGFAERLLADGLRSAEEALAQRIGTGIELVGRRKDGSEFPIEIMLSPLTNADGILVTAAIRDITVRKEAERLLERMEGRYRGLLEAAPDGMVVVDQASEIVLLNVRAETQFGYSRDELVGQNVRRIIPEGFAERLLADGLRSADEALEQQIGTGIELYGRRKDGVEFPIEIMLSPLTNADGMLVTAAIRDITIRKEASAQLMQARDEAEMASKAKSRFLAGMSHELRTPLNGVLGYAQLLHFEGGLNNMQERRVSAMLGAGKHLLQMINSVLDLSEIEADHIELQPVEFDLRDAANVCLDFVRPAAETKGLKLSLVVKPGTRNRITTDPMRLRQILLNLLGNSIKFTAQGSVELRIRARTGRVGIRFEVVDTGPGISAEHRISLFQEFERLDAGSSSVEGAGLGLAIAARLAALLGGSLGYEDNPRGGSIVCLELPLMVGISAASSPAQAPVANISDTHANGVRQTALRILVVDDIAINREIAGAFLKLAGHEIVYAEGGAEAVDATATADFDVVLMDIRMPEVDGLEATRRIRGLAGPRSRVPIVALTAQAFSEQVNECRQAGMDGHLTKPFTPDALLGAVADAKKKHLEGELALIRREMANVFPVRGTTHVPAPTAKTAASADPDFASELPAFNLEAFERTAALLPPEMVISHLQMIDEQAEILLRELQAPDSLKGRGNQLVEASHALAGSAGLFGFDILAAAARNFERAVPTGTEEVSVLAHGLSAAVAAALLEIRRRAPAGPQVEVVLPRR